MSTNPALPDLTGRRVFLTGATGFIGGRLVERLCRDCNASVRVLVNNLSRASRIARFPIEMVQGDVTDQAVVDKAAEGCDIVYHFACSIFGTPERVRAVTVDGTKHVLDAARRNNASRVIPMSTIEVYGERVDGDLDETKVRDLTGELYTDIKLEAENMALGYTRDHGLPVAVIQPTIVYGPYSASWTMRVVDDLKRGRFLLINGGDGLCNAVYIDDLVSALLLAAVRDEAVGEAFLISGAEPVTWAEFYRRHADMLGLGEDWLVAMPADEALARFNEQKQDQGKRRSVVKEMLHILRDTPPVRQRVARSLEIDAVRRVARLIVPKKLRQSAHAGITGIRAKARAAAPNGAPADIGADAASGEPEVPLQLMGPGQIDLHVAKTHVRIDKARRLLGYEPAFDFAAGMERTREWAEWAGLLHR